VKQLAVLFAILTLLLSMQPSIAMAGNEIGSSCCQDEACAASANEEDKDSNGAGEESCPCNPFQCHTCCFLFLPSFPVFAWLQEPFVLTHSSIHPTLVYSLYPPSFWQPPKIV
jgi:hypothetical protein